MDLDDKIFVAGHSGMVGSAIVRELERLGYTNILTRGREFLPLTCQKMVDIFFDIKDIKHVFLAAAKVGGIHANETYPAEFIYNNLMIQSNVINSAYKHGVDRLLFLGSSCIYPRMCTQPIQESELLSGPLEPTNEAYAIAKIAGIKMCQSYNKQYGTNFRSVMPTNLYGPNDNFHYENSHVIPAIMRKIHDAKENNESHVSIWGSGKAKRDFLHVDDLAKAAVHVCFSSDSDYVNQTPLNVGSGEDMTIHSLAETLKYVVGYDGGLVFDSDKPDGTPRKILDVTKMNNLGWSRKIDLEIGLADTYQWFLENQESFRR